MMRNLKLLKNLIVLEILNISIGWKVWKVCIGIERLMRNEGRAFLKSPVKMAFYYGFDNLQRIPEVP